MIPNDWAHTIDQLIEEALSRVNTCLPGIVTEYNRTTRLAKVQPTLQMKYQSTFSPKGFKLVTMPVISNVPVAMPTGAGAGIRIPVAVGDTVILLFSQRSIDTWLSKGGVVDPADPRKFDLNDAIAVPGLMPTTSPLPTDTGADTSLAIVNGDGFLEVTAAGRFKMFTAGVEALLQLSNSLGEVINAFTGISSALGALASGTVLGSIPTTCGAGVGATTGPGMLDGGTTSAASSAQTAVNSAKAAIQTAKNNFDTVRG